VSGAATRFDGQVSVFDFRRPDSPCYNCLYPEDSEAEETRCAVMGVFAPLVGIVGSMQAAEALKLLAGMEPTLHGRLLTLDALTMQPRVMKLARDPQCAVCSEAS
jgi:adenylyltransferase/sulfurtransferase